MLILKRILGFTIGVSVFTLLLNLAYNYDLQINTFLYNPKNILGLWANHIGAWPAYMGVPLAGWSLLCLSKKLRNKITKLVFWVLGVLITLAGCYVMFESTNGYMFGKTKPLLGIQVGAVVTVLLILHAFFSKQKRETIFKIGAFSAFYCVATMIQTIIINVMKSMWNRTRFDTMLNNDGDFDRFTSWVDLGGNGGTSFPSGHTIAAASILLCVFLPLLFKECKGDEKKFLFIGYVYTGLVALGRIIIGRHYLSDVTMSMLVATILLTILWYLPPVKKYFAWVRRKTEKHN